MYSLTLATSMILEDYVDLNPQFLYIPAYLLLPHINNYIHMKLLRSFPSSPAFDDDRR